MHLFKRLLLTKFPNSTIQNSINPASMFVGFISAKEFFSIINRKIIENYKLNLFDVNLDPVEFKMGFGEESNSSKQKEQETYFAYAVAANLNGSLFYSPANLANVVSMLSSLYFKDAMMLFSRHYFVQLVYTVFLLTFTFVGRIKVFPSDQDQENYNWFVEVFFDFYKITFEQLQTEVTEKEFQAVKKALLQETTFFFFLFYFYKRLNRLLEDKSSDEDFLDWLFGNCNAPAILKAFKENYQTTKFLPHSSALEQSVLQQVWPADILLKYLFGETDPMIAVDTIIATTFDRVEFDPLIQSFLTGDQKLFEVIDSLLEYKKYKYGFFSGIQNYIIKALRSDGQDDILEDIDEMLSAIDNGDDISHFDVPERIKRESRVTERLLNFYVSLVGGLDVARGDSFYLRLFKPEFLHVLTKNTLTDLLASDVQLEYFGLILHQYSKNLYYYNYIEDNIRSGKNKFSLPLKGKDVKTVTNFSVIKLYVEAMIAAFFQDMNPKDTKLTVKNTQIFSLFKEQFGDKISEWVQLPLAEFIKKFYASLLLDNQSEIFSVLETSLTQKDIINLKDSLYKLDFWLSYSLLEKLSSSPLVKRYCHSLLLAIFGSIRETFFGLALIMVYCQENLKKNPNEIHEILLFVYVQDILGIKGRDVEKIVAIIRDVIENNAEILKLWIGLDDNRDFFALFARNWKKFTAKKTEAQVFVSFTQEDFVWFRGLLKNVSYYNKRFLIPR